MDTITHKLAGEIEIGDRIWMGDSAWPITDVRPLGVAVQLIGPGGRLLREPGVIDTVPCVSAR